MYRRLKATKDTYITNKIIRNSFRATDANVGEGATLDLFKLYNENKIEEILNEFNSFKSLSASTKKRRISTIKNWVKWLNTNIEK